MRKILLALALFAAAAVPAFAAQATAICTFSPPDGIAVGESGVEYAIEAQAADGTWYEAARGAGVATGLTVEKGQLSITYTTNVPFGLYTVRVRQVKPEPPGPASVTASTTLVPGPPRNPKIDTSRSAVSTVAVPPAYAEELLTGTPAKPGKGNARK